MAQTSNSGACAVPTTEHEPEVLERLLCVQRLLNKIGIAPKKILDVAGNSTTSAHWATHFPDAEVFCVNLRRIDHSPNLRITDIQHDLTNGPLPVRDCDFVFAGEIIEHVFEIDRFIGNIRTAAAIGGVVAITTPNLAVWTNRLLLMMGQPPFNYDAMPVRMPTFRWLRRPPASEAHMSFCDYHIRVFTMRQLLYFASLHGIRPLCSTTAMSTSGRWAPALKRTLAWVLPKGMRDTLILVGQFLGPDDAPYLLRGPDSGCWQPEVQET